MSVSTLRELVAAWRAQSEKCTAAFAAMDAGVCRELDAVGGYATTSPGKDGYCQGFYRQPEWRRNTAGFATTHHKAGTEDDPQYGPNPAPFQRDKAPHLPEVGDRCRALDQAWRREGMALTEAMLAIQRHVQRYTGRKSEQCDENTVTIVAMAASLVDDEASEREAASAWVHKNAIEHLEAEKRLRPTDPQRADFSRVAYDALLYSAEGIHRGEHLR